MCLIFLFVGFQSFGQTKNIDSLKRELAKAQRDSLRSDLNEQISYEFLYLKPDSAKKYIKKSLELALLYKGTWSVKEPGVITIQVL